MTEKCILAGFKDRGREPQAKECRQLLEARKDKEMGSPLNPPGRNTASIASWFSRSLTSDLGNTRQQGNNTLSPQWTAGLLRTGVFFCFLGRYTCAINKYMLEEWTCGQMKDICTQSSSPRTALDQRKGNNLKVTEKIGSRALGWGGWTLPPATSFCWVACSFGHVGEWYTHRGRNSRERWDRI